jgi:hypothetical protein
MTRVSTGTVAERFALADRAPNADAAYATLGAPFQGRTATELRRIYAGHRAARFDGEELAQAVRAAWNARHDN